jgi:nucleolin
LIVTDIVVCSFGYVEFATTAQATAAIEGKHQSVYEGRRLVVNYQAATKRENGVNAPSKTLFIGNLAFEMSDADLNKLFRDIRNVIDVRVAIDRRTGQPRGFAHADFVDVESAQKGHEALKDKEVYGRKLRVDYSAGSTSREVRTGGGRQERDN